MCDVLPEYFPSLYMFANYQGSQVKLKKKKVKVPKYMRALPKLKKPLPGKASFSSSC